MQLIHYDHYFTYYRVLESTWDYTGTGLQSPTVHMKQHEGYYDKTVTWRHALFVTSYCDVGSSRSLFNAMRRTLRLLPSQYGKLGRYLWISSSAKWAKLNKYIILCSCLTELEIQKYLPSFPYRLYPLNSHIEIWIFWRNEIYLL